MKLEEKISILQDVIRIESENDHELAVAEYYQNLLQHHGIESQLIEYTPGRSNLIAEIKGNQPGKVLVFSGHLDVVSAYDSKDWTYPPFEGRIVEGRMYGRGTVDMKSGLSALIIAMIEMKESKIPFKGVLRLVATVGEEIGMYGSKQLVEMGLVDDADGFIIGEPSGPNQIINAHKGSIQYEIIAHGMSAHSSMPELGVDALQLMVDYINETNKRFEEAFSKAKNEQLGRTLNVNTVIEGGDQINSVAGKVTMKANARTVPEVGNDVVVGIIESVIHDLNEQGTGKLELNMLQNNPSVVSEKENDLVLALREATGRDIPAIMLPGATDASNFGRIDKTFDLAIFGPGDFSVAHMIDEFVSVQEYLDFIDIYRKAAEHYLN